MTFNIEKARILFKLIRRGKTSKNCCDRLEFYKRFSKKALDDLKKEGLVVVTRNGKQYDKIYIPNEKLKEAIEFVDKNLDEVKFKIKPK